MRTGLRSSLLVLCGLLSAPFAGAEQPPRGDLGGFHRPVTTEFPAAQEWFDRGLLACYAFNHDESIRCFEAALAEDPGLAMAWWGIAYARGPHINNPLPDPAEIEAAVLALKEAEARADAAAPVERALIAALAMRYASPPPEDRAPLDQAYAEAMRAVHAAHPDDADVLPLFAEALMNLHPWDLWVAGVAQPWTGEILALLEAALQRSPRHPLANHLYIHAVEASPTPEKGLAAANLLRTLAPESGHLLHMPAHIDVRIGDYAAAIEANRRAIAADERHVARRGRGGLYDIYRAHNHHFLAYAAMFDGQSKVAIEAARAVPRAISPELLEAAPDFTEGLLAAPLHALVRFGRWEEILAEPAPPAGHVVTTAFWNYARGVALASLGRVEESAAALGAFDLARVAVPESRLIGNNTALAVLEVARPMLEGELEYRRGNHDVAFARLRDAVRLDDALRYDEPWGWMQPVRHALGALFLEQGRVEEAEAVYREDLSRNPANGWSLHGLAECLKRRGADEEAAETEARFHEVWARADVTIAASCFCRRGS
jgi:tetratricopeptide (TPR) repeat protein